MIADTVITSVDVERFGCGLASAVTRWAKWVAAAANGRRQTLLYYLRFLTWSGHCLRLARVRVRLPAGARQNSNKYGAFSRYARENVITVLRLCPYFAGSVRLPLEPRLVSVGVPNQHESVAFVRTENDKCGIRSLVEDEEVSNMTHIAYWILCVRVDL
jgi:hypothetical protein